MKSTTSMLQNIVAELSMDLPISAFCQSKNWSRGTKAGEKWNGIGHSVTSTIQKQKSLAVYF